MKIPERSAITRLKQGDLKRLEFLVQEDQVQAVHASYLITGDRFLAEEIVQAVLTTLPHLPSGGGTNHMSRSPGQPLNGSLRLIARGPSGTADKSAGMI